LSKISVCGRVHFGPCCVNGGPRREPTCVSCGEVITEADRDTINRTWDTVREMLAKYKDAKA
jgi:hypothetical protein